MMKMCIIPAFVEMEDELADASLNYLEPVSIGLRARNGRRKLKRGMDLTKKDLTKIWSTPFEEMKLTATADMKTTI